MLWLTFYKSLNIFCMTKIKRAKKYIVNIAPEKEYNTT